MTRTMLKRLFAGKLAAVLLAAALMPMLPTEARADDDEMSRLLSYVAQLFVVDVALDQTAVQAYLDEAVNPELPDASLTSLGSGLVVFFDRVFRNRDGGILGDGHDLTVALFLVVSDPAAPSPPGVTLLLVGSFQNTKAVIDYMAENHLREYGAPSQVGRRYEVEGEGLGDEMESSWWASDERGSIDFEVEFVAPAPYLEPLVLDDAIQEHRVRLRFAHAPARLFAFYVNRAVFERPLSDNDDSFQLDIDFEDQQVDIDGLHLFDGITEDAITRFRSVAQVMEINELL